MNDKRCSTTQILRHLIQIASFILIPGLFILTLYSVKDIYTSILQGTFSLASTGPSIALLLAVLPITILWGRFFCGYMCAFGSMQELLNFIARKLKIKQITIPAKIEKKLKWIKYAVFVLLVVTWTLSVSIDTFSPWTVFGQYSSYKGWKTFSYLMTFGGALLLLIVIASLFSERIFCRYFCPVGAMFSLISRPRLFKLKRSTSACINCGKCSTVCPMHIDILEDSSKSGKVMSGECIDCFRCSEACAVNAINSDSRAAISGTLGAASIGGLYFIGTLLPYSDMPGNRELASTSVAAGQNVVSDMNLTDMADGTYSGTGSGYRGDTKVSVTVKNGEITDITIESYQDDDRFFNKASDTIISEILSAQSCDVKTVSGATYSSRGIIAAVADALNIEYSSAILEEGNEGHGKGSGSEGKKKDSSSADGEEHEERVSSGEHKGRKKK